MAATQELPNDATARRDRPRAPRGGLTALRANPVQNLGRRPEGQPPLPSASSPIGGTARSALAAGALDGFLEHVAEHVAARVIEALEPRLERPARPALLDRRGLASELDVGIDTVDRLRAEGMPELRVGDAPRFELEAVLVWLRGRS